jgi:potassium uptake TrkH family protein
MGGSLLLLLPASTYDGISYLDALFTSTSAVCVTGLIVVDTGSYFTFFGQMVIMALIQIGGLGIMTFTSYFSYFFKGGSSYQNQLLMMKMTNSEKLADVFSTLKLIIFITFLIEAIGGTIIFFSIDKTVIESFNDRVFFSAFHSVSGFCNAGFSTLQESLYQPAFRFNYPLHLTIAFLFVLGGLGFPIFFNLIRYIRHIIIKSFHLLFTNRKDLSLPWVINLNTRIILISTSILILVGTIGFYILEYNNTLAEHSGLGKVVTAFFGAVTPRTAGFNTVDTSALGYPTVLFVIFLMWIGASPASTGGGIKTSTFAVGIINIFSAIKGKKDVELYGREISNFSIKRANSIIILSLLTIGLGIFSISLVDSHLGLLSITFETFSAFSTVGLSRGITANLSSFSKFIIIITMFVGRISVLTLLIALFRRERHRSYRYPSEDILIN